MLSLKSVCCHSNQVNAHASDATIIVRFGSTSNSGTQLLYKYETFRSVLQAGNLFTQEYESGA